MFTEDTAANFFASSLEGTDASITQLIGQAEVSSCVDDTSTTTSW